LVLYQILFALGDGFRCVFSALLRIVWEQLSDGLCNEQLAFGNWQPA
jgi:hypothetical protein